MPVDVLSGAVLQAVLALSAEPDMRLWRRAPLAPFTTIGVGGRGAVLVTVATPEAAARALAILTETRVPWAALGAGSNVVVADSGYTGVILKLDDAFQYVEGPFGSDRLDVDIVVGAAAPLPRVATFLADQGYGGLEFACGVPGTVGGGVAMNAGAHGGCMADVVKAVEVAVPGETGWLSAEDLEWRYRRCTLPREAMVLSVRLSVTPGDREQILTQHRMLQRRRRQTQPRGVRTFGSVFANPPGDVAGRLLEAAGMKGVRRGGAQVSNMHANFLTNVGDATAADVLGLMAMMREAVWRRSGVLLEPEVRVLGAEFPWERGEAERPVPRAGRG